MSAGQDDQLGDLVRAKRMRESLNLRQAGQASGVAYSTLGRIENGGTPTLVVARKIEAWLNGCAPTLPTPPMTLRDHFAGEALPAIIVATSAGQHVPVMQASDPHIRFAIARDAYEMADAMLAARQEQGK